VERQKELAKLFVSGLVWRLTDELGQVLDMAQVGLLGRGGQAPQLHVLTHPLP
jgi:hypothetical protein